MAFEELKQRQSVMWGSGKAGLRQRKSLQIEESR